MNGPEPALTGGCLCGAVRYRVTAAALRVNHCHCAMCRRATGAAVATWVTLPAAALVWTAAKPRVRRSSPVAVRGFCPDCGSALTWQGDGDPARIDLAAGSLDAPERVAPAEHLWTENQIPWLRIEDGLPRFRRGRRE